EGRRSLRLVPLVVAAAASLFVLKAVGLIAVGEHSFASLQAAYAQSSDVPAAEPSRHGKADREGGPFDRTGASSAGPAPVPQKGWTQEVFGSPEYTGTVPAPPGEKGNAPAAAGAKPEPKPPSGEPKAAAGEAKGKPGEAKTTPADAKGGGAPAGFAPDHPSPSAGERAVLESLNQRRQELETRARELDRRDNPLAASEHRGEARPAEIKAGEERINATVHKKDEAEAARFKALVSMYENMKPKDAAKIFDRLDMRILVELSAQLNPRRMSDILGQMSPEVAERLT